MLKKCFIFMILFISVFVCLFEHISYATPTQVTKENLNEAIQKLATSNEMTSNIPITVGDNTISASINNETYILNYDLTGKPTFSIEIPIEKGISYEAFENKVEQLNLPLLGYMAVANIQGVDVESIITYVFSSYVQKVLANTLLNGNSCVVVDDLNNSDIEKTDDPNTFYTSEFGDRVLEYIEKTYKDTQTISDENTLNSYVYKMGKKDMTDTSCVLMATLSVNTDADFSQISTNSNDVYDEITKETADYVVLLKVGQICNIESNVNITSYEIFGDTVDFNENGTIMTATKIGVSKGYINIGDEKKSIYVEVEENLGNEVLEPVKLKINKTNVNDETPQSPETPKPSKAPNVSPTPNSGNNNTQEKLPQTGLNNSVTIAIIIVVIGVIVAGIKLKKYKDIK